jgi:hypothetical protein
MTKHFLLAAAALAATLTTAAPEFTVKLLAVDPNEACAIADYNKDGVLDVSAGRSWYAGPDYVPRPVRAIAEFGKDYQENNGEHVFDVNKDGWPDIVAGSFVTKEDFW